MINQMSIEEWKNSNEKLILKYPNKWILADLTKGILLITSSEKKVLKKFEQLKITDSNLFWFFQSCNFNHKNFAKKECSSCKKVIHAVCKKCQYCNKELVKDNNYLKILDYVKKYDGTYLSIKKLLKDLKLRRCNGKPVTSKLIKNLCDENKISIILKRNVDDVHGLAKYKNGCRCNICKLSNYLLNYLKTHLKLKVKERIITDVINKHLLSYKYYHQYRKLLISILPQYFEIELNFNHGYSGYKKGCRCTTCIIHNKIHRCFYFSHKIYLPVKILKTFSTLELNELFQIKNRKDFISKVILLLKTKNVLPTQIKKSQNHVDLVPNDSLNGRAADF